MEQKIFIDATNPAFEITINYGKHQEKFNCILNGTDHHLDGKLLLDFEVISKESPPQPPLSERQL